MKKVCMTQLQPVLATSKSDPYKKYEITLRPVDSKYPKCTCVAFAMARNRARKGLEGQNADVEAQCKHIKEVLKTACDWTGDADVCPKCGSKTVAEGKSVAITPIPVVEGPAPVTGMPELRPMLANEIAAERMPTYLEDDGWWAEQKIDGHRVLIHVLDGQIMVLGRGGQASQHGARFTQPHYKDIGRLPNCVIDGELVGDTFWLFDLPHCDSRGITIDSPYRDRREALEWLYDWWGPNDQAYALLSTAKTDKTKAQLALECFQAGGEGLMLKNVTGPYKPGGRVSTVLKAKFVKTADVIVTAVGTSGKENYVLSVYQDDKLIEIGRCSSIGKAVVEVGTVIEVKYLNLAANDRLYQPRMVKVRTDKQPHECLWSQFDHARVNKEVLNARL